ncbi:PH domain-containing protein [Kibdelosporangium lantanae]
MSERTAFQARPYRIRYVAGGLALLFLAVFTVVAILLRSDWTGAYFGVSDQIAMVGIGVVLAGGVLSLVRARVRADESGVEVRNVLNTHWFSWDDVEHVSFPDGASFARLELPDDEYVTILAIPAVDGARSVAAIRELRRLMAAAHTSASSAE